MWVGAGTDRDLGSEAYRAEDFPGCESFHLPAGALDRHEGRLEFWDGVTETAWKVCDTTIQHEAPSRRLVQMAERVAALRGSRIACFGSANLVRFDVAGRKRWLMQADEVLYLHPGRSRLQGSAIDVDADPLPDVVLEVDHTTDVRRRKLEMYKGSGFAEIWVLVPWEVSVRAPGLTIHVRRGEGYREEAASRAFAQWRVEEIYRALTEGSLVGRSEARAGAGGAGDGRARGTRPEDDPFTRSISRMAQARGRREMLAANVLAVLKARGIEVALDFTQDRELVGGLSGEALIAAALACADEADFRRRIREQLDPRAELRR